MIEPQGKQRMAPDSVEFKQIKALLEDDYQLGVLDKVYEIFGGYVNRSFGVEVIDKDGKSQDYFVRRYRRENTDEDILFEHKIVTYAIGNGFDLAADVVAMEKGKTFIRKDWEAEEDGEVITYPWAVYRYLHGGDPYDWINNHLKNSEYASMGRTLARFHAACDGFDGGVKGEAQIYELLEENQRAYPRLTDGVELTDYHRFIHSFNDTLDYVLNLMKKIRKGMEDSGMLDEGKGTKVYCHSDFHVSNVKWKDGEVCGVFDFDWTKLDYRLIDIGYSLFISMGNWDTFKEATIDPESVKAYLSAYIETTKELKVLPVFSEEEKKAFPYMFMAGGMYLYNWCMDFFYDWKNNNEYEYCYYLDHIVRTLRFAEEHAEENYDLICSLS